MLYICEKFHQSISAITKKVGKPDLWFTCSARRLIVFYICVKFPETISNGFQLTKRTRVHDRNGYIQCSKGNNSKSRQTELRFTCSACRFIVLYICVKFPENISNGFQLTKRTRVHGRNGYVQCSKGNTSKSRKLELRFMCSALCLKVVYICVKFGENIADGIRVMKRTRMIEALTDRQTDGHSKVRTV